MSLGYKFLSLEHAYKVLETGLIKVSTIRELNDVFDCSPILKARPGHEQEDELMIGKTMPWTASDYGLLCLSCDYRSPLLWGHYAGSATGVAIGFDPDQFDYDHLLVGYEKDRPILELPDLHANDPKEYKKFFVHCFGVKAKEWEYEQEVRFVVRLRECQCSNGMYFIRYTQPMIKELIIGHRCKADPLYLKRIFAKLFGGQVTIRQSRPHPTKYEIEAYDFVQT